MRVEEHESEERQHDVAGVLDEVVRVMDRLGLPYLLVGGIAASVYGTQSRLRDIDLFLTEEGAHALLDGLRHKGFSVEKAEPRWLLKATRNEMVVDILFRIGEKVHLDDDMLRRGRWCRVNGTRVRVVSPEDLVVSLALADRQDTHYWYSALDVMRNVDIEWDYFVRRGMTDPLRLLSLLLYAVSDGIDVSWTAVRRLWAEAANSMEMD